MNSTEAKSQLLSDISNANLSVASDAAYEAQFDDCVDAHKGNVGAAYTTCKARIDSAAEKLKGHR